MANPIKPPPPVTLKPAPFDIPKGIRVETEPRFSLVRVPQTAKGCTVRQVLAIIRGMVKDEI